MSACRDWYLGTADAVYQNIDIIESPEAKFNALLAGDHIYKMDYEWMSLGFRSRSQQIIDTSSRAMVG